MAASLQPAKKGWLVTEFPPVSRWKLLQQPQRRFRHPARRVVAAQLLIEGSQPLFQAKLSKILQVKEMPAVEIGFRAPEPQRFIQRSGLRGRKSDLAQTLLGFAGS